MRIHDSDHGIPCCHNNDNVAPSLMNSRSTVLVKSYQVWANISLVPYLLAGVYCSATGERTGQGRFACFATRPCWGACGPGREERLLVSAEVTIVALVSGALFSSSLCVLRRVDRRGGCTTVGSPSEGSLSSLARLFFPAQAQQSRISDCSKLHTSAGKISTQMAPVFSSAHETLVRCRH